MIKEKRLPAFSAWIYLDVDIPFRFGYAINKGRRILHNRNANRENTITCICTQLLAFNAFA